MRIEVTSWGYMLYGGDVAQCEDADVCEARHRNVRHAGIPGNKIELHAHGSCMPSFEYRETSKASV